MRQFDGFTHSKDMSLARLWDMVKDREVWRAVVHRVTKDMTEQLNNSKKNSLLYSFGFLSAFS